MNLDAGKKIMKDFFVPDCLDANEPRTSVIKPKNKIPATMLAPVEPLNVNSVSPRDKIITKLYSPRPTESAAANANH